LPLKSPPLYITIVAILICILFIIVAVPWIDKPGIQTDEALFAGGIYPPFDERFLIHISQHDYPLMVMTYVGALKSRIWAPIFAVWPPSSSSVRIPAVLLGALSIWWVYQLLSRTLGTPAALAGAALLATDPIYVLYSRLDHGPVVIQHLCLAGAMLALARFGQERRAVWLAAGFFALGLGLWEKAVFMWLISGLGIAALVLYRPRIRSAITCRNLVTATAAFALGASPLIAINVSRDLITFRGNTVWSSEGIAGKARLLRATLDGEALFGSMIRECWDGPLREPSTAVESATVSIALWAGMPRQDLMGYLAVASILLLPLVWRTPARTAALFVLISMAVAWLQMAFVKGAGTGAHHTILLWPLPTIGIAAVLSAASRKFRFGRALLFAVVVTAAGANLLVLSTYYTNLLRNGGTPSWTDAMYPAFNAIHRMDKEAVCTVDWGFRDTLRLFEKGGPICQAADPVDPEGQGAAMSQVSKPGYVFLTHTEGNESFPGITARLVRFAESKGFRRVNLRGYADTNGRTTVETFQFASALDLRSHDR
jgi:4-amino-4-deoxy-L-arabinose transferase-like glycosyltransferase